MGKKRTCQADAPDSSCEQTRYASDTAKRMGDGDDLNLKKWRYVLKSVVFSVVVLALFFCAKKWLFTNFEVDGSSMEKTYFDGDVVWVLKVAKPDCGDVVIVDMNKKDKEGKDVYYIKRVVALGGDSLWVERYEDGGFYLCRQRAGSETEERLTDESYDGVVLDRIDKEHLFSYFLHAFGKENAYVVPDGTVFCVGDNRNDSMDSRALGPFDEDDVEGVVVGEGMTVVWVTAGVAAAALIVVIILMLSGKKDVESENGGDGCGVSVGENDMSADGIAQTEIAVDEGNTGDTGFYKSDDEAFLSDEPNTDGDE